MEGLSSQLAEPVLTVAQRILSTRDKEVAHYAKLYPLLLAQVDEIMADWEVSSDALPWSLLEAKVRQNNLAEVITRVIDCAMSSSSREVRVEGLLDAAAAHGDCRRGQGVDVESLFTEYDHIRTATWNTVKDLVDSPTSYDAIFVIDGLLSIASRGTVLGYHRRLQRRNN